MLQAQIVANSQQEKVLKQQSAALQEQCVLKNQKLYVLNSKINQENVNINSLEKKIADGIGLHEQNLIAAKQKKKEIESKKVKLGKEIEDTDSKMDQMLFSLSTKQRADLLIKLWATQDEDSQLFTQKLSQLKFDANYVNSNGQNLINIAVIKNDISLFNLIIKQDPSFNFEQPTIAKQTLLEYASAHGHSKIADIILDGQQDLGRTVLHCLKDNNLQLFDKILAAKADRASSCYEGHPLLQLAIAAKKTDAVKLILKHNAKAVEQVNFKDESSFLYALKCGHVEIIKTLINSVDVDQQIGLLIQGKKLDELATLIEAVPELIERVDTKALYELVKGKENDMFMMLADYGSKVDLVIEATIEQKDKESFSSLFKMDNDYFYESKIRTEKMLVAAREFGLNDIAQKLKQIQEDQVQENQAILFDNLQGAEDGADAFVGDVEIVGDGGNQEA